MFDDVLEHCLQPVLCNYLSVIGYLSVEYAVNNTIPFQAIP